MASITIIPRYGPENDEARQRRLRTLIRAARMGRRSPRPRRLEHEDMIDLTGRH